MKALTPIEQKTVLFYEDEVTAVIVEAEGRRQVYIPLRPICDRLGLDWSSQVKRINRDEILAKAVMSVVIMTTDIDPQSRRPRASDMVCLPLTMLNGWLFGVTASRVKAEIRPALLRYQRECFEVLYEAMRDGQLSTSDPDFDTLLHQASTDAVEAYQLAMAVVKLARNQVLLEAQLGQHGRVLDDYGRRLESIEATLRDPERYVSREQAARISQAVKAVGHALTQRNGRSEYAAVYGDLYRNFDVSSYKEIPSAQYEQVMAWLNAWYQRLTNSNIPF